MKLKLRENNNLKLFLVIQVVGVVEGVAEKLTPDGGGGGWLQHGCCLFFAPKPSFFLEHLSLSTSLL